MERSHWVTLQWRILLMLLKTKSYIIQGSCVAIHHSRIQAFPVFFNAHEKPNFNFACHVEKHRKSPGYEAIIYIRYSDQSPIIKLQACVYVINVLR